MWARVVEVMLAFWLSLSAFIFHYPGDALFFWYNDLACSSLMLFFALISYNSRLRKMHLLQVLLGLYLIGLNYFWADRTLFGPLQNYAVLGLLLLMIGLVPTDADKPPKPWRDFFSRHIVD